MVVESLTPIDRIGWETLVRDYQSSTTNELPHTEFDDAWERLMRQEDLFSLGAKIDGKLVGIAHYLFHATTWGRCYCYLQDLYSAPEFRGRGIATALIHAVAAEARLNRAEKFYWHVQNNNATVRILYDKLAENKGSIRYEYAVG